MRNPQRRAEWTKITSSGKKTHFLDLLASSSSLSLINILVTTFSLIILLIVWDRWVIRMTSSHHLVALRDERNEFIPWWGLSLVCVTRTQISWSRSVEKYRRWGTSFLPARLIYLLLDHQWGLLTGHISPIKWWPGCSLLCSGTNLLWKKSPFFFTFSAPCGQARSYSKESNNRIIFFFFAKTIKTVVAGSFVP